MGAFLHDYDWLVGDEISRRFEKPASHQDIVRYAQYVVSNMINKLEPGASVTLERHTDPSKEIDGRTFTMTIKSPIDGNTND